MNLGESQFFLMKPKKMTTIKPTPLAMINPKPTFLELPNACCKAVGGGVGVCVGAGVRVGNGVRVGRGWVGVEVFGTGVLVKVGVGVGSEAGKIMSVCPSKTCVVPWLKPEFVKI